MHYGITAVVALSALLSYGSQVKIIEDGRSDWKIVYGSGERDRLAAEDLQDIFKKATGMSLELRVKSGECRTGRCFLVGAEFAGRALLDEQTWVGVRDGNIVLAGGGVAGSCYAVYDFCETCFGYRCYGVTEEDEIVKRTADLAWDDGKVVSTRPTFCGYREWDNFPTPLTWQTDAARRFMRRNRCNAWDKPSTRLVLGAQHAMFLYVPAHDGFTWLDKEIGTHWKGAFKEHPEWFSMDRDGKRSDRAQLCFANRELRKVFIARFREYAAKKGPGLYTVAANDFHNERYCWCPECAKMMEKYKTNAGPVLDFCIELCEAVKDMKEVYVRTFAYKGPEQTELAPTGVIFPDNFNIDVGFLNSDRTPSEVADTPLPDGRTYNRLANLKAWAASAKNTSYAFYSGCTAISGWRRAQAELREVAAAGVISCGCCGVGGYPEFQDMICGYLVFQLLRNPDYDCETAETEIFRHRFGAAADLMQDYYREVQEMGRRHVKTDPEFIYGTDDYCNKIPVEGADVIRWQGYFDRALAKVRDDPRRTENVQIARLGVDTWTLSWAVRVRKADPSYKIDAAGIVERGLRACDALEKRSLVRKNGNYARRALGSLRYYANLKTDALPKELGDVDPMDVRLYLPEDRDHLLYPGAALRKDPKAIAGVAMQSSPGVLKEKDGSRKSRLTVELEDGEEHKTLFAKPCIDVSMLADGEYHLVKVGTARVPRTGFFVLGDGWGSSCDVRTLGRYYDATYHEKLYEYWVSVRIEGDDLLCDRIYLVDKGMP